MRQTIRRNQDYDSSKELAGPRAIEAPVVLRHFYQYCLDGSSEALG